jgi:purine-binding chemotaxis protein CheW
MGDWVIFELKEQRYGVRAEHVSEMVILESTAAIARAPAAVRGLLNLRGRVFPVLDLRLRLGLPSAPQELEDLCQLLKVREQDHVRWLDELEACVREQREFKLALDPTKCAFGKWYYAYRPENSVLRLQLAKLAEPHRLIHETARHVMRALAEGAPDRAQAAMASARLGTLATLRRLLDETSGVIREQHSEIAIITGDSSGSWGLIVDAAIGVRSIRDSEIEPPQPGSLGAAEDCLTGFCQFDHALTLLLDLPRLSPLAADGGGCLDQPETPPPLG